MSFFTTPEKGDQNFTTDNQISSSRDTKGRKRRRPIPRDEKTISKAARVIDGEFDLEILLRQHELQKIQEEVEKVEETLLNLKQCLLEAPSNTPPLDSSLTSYVYERGSSMPSIIPKRQSTRKIVSTRDKDYLYFDPCRDLFSRRNDGTFVKLTCPECHRSRFINVQGFLNHCRLSHKIEFPNHEEALLLCGTPVDESIVPPDHPARSKILTGPPSLRSILSQSEKTQQAPRYTFLFVPKIKEYDENIEDIELGLDDALSHSEETSSSLSVIPEQDLCKPATKLSVNDLTNDGCRFSSIELFGDKNLESTSPTTTSRPIQVASLPVSVDLTLTQLDLASGNVTDSFSSYSESDSESIDISAEIQQYNRFNGLDMHSNMLQSVENSMLRISSQQTPQSREGNFGVTINASSNISGFQTKGSLNTKIDKYDAVGKGSEESGHVGKIIPLTGKQPFFSSILKFRGNKFPDQISLPQEIKTISAVAFTTPACSSVFDPIDAGSRFYVKRRIVIGNVSRWISAEKRHLKLQKYTHKWMIYVVGPPHSLNVTSFIRKVRFYLHPSYRPHDIVDVTEPPFQLTRYGWGEFPVRAQLFFLDKKNKPVDLIHLMKLDETHCGKQRLGDERAYDLELDRNTEFVEPRKEKSLERSSSHLIKNVAYQTVVGKIKSSALIDDLAESTKFQDNTPKLMELDVDFLEPLLTEAVRCYPIINSVVEDCSLSPLPYSFAASAETFLTWEIGHRKSTEWQRARAMRMMVQSMSQAVSNPKIHEVAKSLTTQDVVHWCRRKNYTPIEIGETLGSDLITFKKPQSSHTTYCKYCGCPNFWHKKDLEDNGSMAFKCKKKPRIMRKKNGKLSSLKLAKEIFDDLGGAGSHEEHMDIDVLDYNNSAFQDIPSTSSNSANPADNSNQWFSTIFTSDLNVIGWVWDVIFQLRLKSFVGTEIENGDTSITVQQRLVAGNFIAQVTRIFLKDILNKSIEIYRNEEKNNSSLLGNYVSITKKNKERSLLLDFNDDIDDGEGLSMMLQTQNENPLGQPKKLLVPYHLYQALGKNPETDFLTGNYLASEKKRENRGKNEQGKEILQDG